MVWFGLTNHLLSGLWARPGLVRRIYAGNCQFIAQFLETNFQRFLTQGGFTWDNHAQFSPSGGWHHGTMAHTSKQDASETARLCQILWNNLYDFLLFNKNGKYWHGARGVECMLDSLREYVVWSWEFYTTVHYYQQISGFKKTFKIKIEHFSIPILLLDVVYWHSKT